MSQFFNDHEIKNPGSYSESIVALKKFEGKKKLRILKKMLSSWEGLLNADKRQQIAKTIISMFALREIARIYKALKRFADLQGPICYNDAQNKEMNLIVY